MNTHTHRHTYQAPVGAGKGQIHLALAPGARGEDPLAEAAGEVEDGEHRVGEGVGDEDGGHGAERGRGHHHEVVSDDVLDDDDGENAGHHELLQHRVLRVGLVDVHLEEGDDRLHEEREDDVHACERLVGV